METVYLITGVALLVGVIYDFFFTTLSGSGSSFFSGFMSKSTHKAIQVLARHAGRNSFRYSGMMINLSLLIGWVLLIWLGLFLVFSSNPAGLVNDDDQIATTVERLYFTGYTLSTLGMGDIKPVIPAFQVLTSAFSFFGFIFFTTTMTYLLSVSSAVINKRTLALTIRNLGNCPKEISKKLMELDRHFSHQLILSLKHMIDKHSVSHQAYPVIHYYNNHDINSSLSINLASLDEAFTILWFNGNGNHESGLLRKALAQFYIHIEERYGNILHNAIQAQPDYDFSAHGYSSEKAERDPDTKFRRRILGGLLHTENFTWEDVYACKKREA